MPLSRKFNVQAAEYKPTFGGVSQAVSIPPSAGALPVASKARRPASPPGSPCGVLDAHHRSEPSDELELDFEDGFHHHHDRHSEDGGTQRSDSVCSSEAHPDSRRTSEPCSPLRTGPLVPAGIIERRSLTAAAAAAAASVGHGASVHALPPLSLPQNGHVCLPVPEDQELKEGPTEGGGEPAGAAAAAAPAPAPAAPGTSVSSEDASAPASSSSTPPPQPSSESSDPVSRLSGASSPVLIPGDACGAGPDSPSSRIGPDSFEILHVVGQGAFGKVFQVRMISNGALYAMKVMKKEKIVERGHAEYLMAERDILTVVHHPYIVTLRYSFQTGTKLYLILDFINGGHLFFQLYRQGTFDEPLARLYCAELVLAISHLHSRGIVHRDLKPENILLDHTGHIKLTDFGLAKHVKPDERSNSFIGTVEYMAPEVIEGKGHGKEVDWWSVGILVYEMLVGIPPFRSGNKQTLQKKICTEKIKYPTYLSSDALKLMKGFLERDPAKRLGSGDKGSDNVKAHPFFKSINWAKLERMEVASPFRPTIASSESVENFDKIWTDMPPVESPCGTPTKGKNLDVFKGFTYVAPSILLARATAQEAPAAPQFSNY